MSKKEKKSDYSVHFKNYFFFFNFLQLSVQLLPQHDPTPFKPYWFYFPQPAWTCALPSIVFVLLKNQEHRLLVKMSAQGSEGWFGNAKTANVRN